MSFTVYKHTNKVNGKVYIGQTCQPVEKRWGKDGNGYKSSSIFGKAIKEYGWNNFNHEIIKEVFTVEEAVELEKYYIALYKSNDRNYGYNFTSGGEYHIVSDDTKKKISKNGYRYGMLGKKHSEGTKAKMSESRQGHVVTDETKTKQKESALKNRGRLFLCVELNEIFNNLQDALDKTGCSKFSIVHCCKGEQIQSKGYHWQYADLTL